MRQSFEYETRSDWVQNPVDRLVSSRLPGTFISASLQKARPDEPDLGNEPEVQPGLRIGVFG